MKQTSARKISRVQQAHDEVGVTEIRYGAALAFVTSWLFLLFAVLAVDHYGEWQQQKGDSAPDSFRSLTVIEELPDIINSVTATPLSPPAWIRANRRLLERIRETEEDIEEQGTVASWLRPWSQRALLVSGVGNEKVYPAPESWLFYRTDVDSVSGPGFLDENQLRKRTNAVAEWEDIPQPDPLMAIIDFHQQLAARGIKLLVVPVPVKAEILPDKFSSRYPVQQLVRNPSYQHFINQLHEADVWVVDAAKLIMEYQAENQQPAFLLTDTHWAPSAMQWVSSRLADELRNKLEWWDAGPIGTETEKHSISNRGDIAAMLDLPSAWNPYPDETVSVERVLRTDGSLWQANDTAEVLVLGDSFSNIYSLNAMGWGESAGFVEHLSHALQRPVDRIVRNDQGAFATRQLLSRELARGHDRLAGKKVVLYQFATRELVFGDWRFFPFEVQQPPPSDFLHIEAGRKVQVHGTVQEISVVPRPGSVPYRDHVVSIHLVDISQDGENAGSLSQAVVLIRSMTDNVWTPAARIRPGDTLDLTVSNWGDVATELDGLNRSELDELELQLQEPVWGEYQEK
jgi:alginate O-acetyltransferase complex protein AlgJ